jgi:membrane-bound lytic murein transglycosylase MltF
MDFISEKYIEDVIELFDSEPNYLQTLNEIQNLYPDLIYFIDQENHTLLTKEESTILEYLTLVIYQSVKIQLYKIPIIIANDIELNEEKNWDTFNTATSKSFSKILDTFFDGYKQEDLLALIEDSIQQDDENPISSVGREIIFVACKSIIDALDMRN